MDARSRELTKWVIDSRQRTLDLVADLSDEELRVEISDIVNPLDWELGHVAWFQERFVLRDLDGQAPSIERADALFDSMAILHDTRWNLELPARDRILRYLSDTQERVLRRLARVQDLSGEALHRERLAVLHEDMHCEAITYTRQTLAYPAPRLEHLDASAVDAGPLPGDASIPGGVFHLGVGPFELRKGIPADTDFVFDNECGTRVDELGPFEIARTPVTQADFAEFVDSGGYADPAHWSAEGWQWRARHDAAHPVYWRRDSRGDGWERRDFDRWLALEPHRPVICVNWFEASAFCRWSGRRLPSEAEWEAAATRGPDGMDSSPGSERAYPWGEAAPHASRANIDGRRTGCMDVAALPDGDSACGCRQMLGNVWEWCSDAFEPFPGFEPGPYRAYSEPWFGTRKVLRGGSWATRARLARCGYRNFFTPDRRDILAGFRTCALNES